MSHYGYLRGARYRSEGASEEWEKMLLMSMGDDGWGDDDAIADVLEGSEIYNAIPGAGAA